MTRSKESHQPPDAAAEETAARVIAALPDPSLDPAFAQRVLRSARTEMALSQTRWQRTERLFTRVLVPAALVVCALGWTYHVAHIAERVYLSHGG